MVLHFRKATSVYWRTLPFVLLRMGIGVLLGVAAILYFALVAWVGFNLLEVSISSVIGIVGLLAAVGIFYLAWRLLVKYVLYMVKAAHIAVIVHVIDTGEVPDNQISYGIGRVKENFAEASALFVVDRLVKAVIKQFNRGVISVSNLVAFVPTLRNVVRLVGRAIAIAASYIDEAIVAHMFRNAEQNRWRSARDGVVLYGKNWKPVLGSTLLIVVGLYAVGFVLLMSLTPLASVLSGFSTTFELLGWVVVGGMVLTVHTGFLRPWVKTVVITTFLVESQGQAPDSETADRIANRSEKFQELVAKADASERTAGSSIEDDPRGVTTPDGKLG